MRAWIAALASAAALLVAPAPAGAETSRVAGDADTPTQAAVAVSREEFAAGGAEWAVLARDDAFADALTGAVVAAARGPVLFTDSVTLTVATEAELERVLPGGRTVYLMGGRAAISEVAATQLATRWHVERVAGPDRIHTALAATRLVAARDRGGQPASTAYVAAGFRWPDAITGGAAAARSAAALYLVDETQPPDAGSNADVVDALNTAAPQRVTILGGAAAVPPGFEAAIAPTTAELGRLAGTDRAGTALLVAGDRAPVTIARGFPHGGETDRSTDVWGFALAASGRVAARGGGLLLVHGEPTPGTWDGVPVAVATHLHRRCDLAAEVVGSPAVLSDATLREVERLRCAGPPGVDVQVMVSGLQHPWAVADLGDGRLLVTERDRGHVRLVQDGVLLPTAVWSAPDLYADGEAGLMGIVAQPDVAQTGSFYVCATQRAASGPRIRVHRLRLAGATATHDGLVADLGRAAPIHDGCALAITRAGHLLATSGDASDASRADDPTDPNGKVHRVLLDGRPADGNRSGSVWTIGHRNPQGVDQHPVTDAVLAAEHGPDHDDEVNVLLDGGDYGWPRCSGPCDDASIDPIWASGSSTIATSGAAFAEEAAWQALRGALLVATLKDRTLRALPLTPDGTRATGAMITLLDGDHGRLRGVTPATGGGVWVTTSNGENDRILRVTPR